MGIFSRIFKGGPPDGRDEDKDAKETEDPTAESDGTPSEASGEADLTEPVSAPIAAPVAAPSPALATAAGGPTAPSSPFATPLWSWPQRGAEAPGRREGGPAGEDASPPAAPGGARQEAPMARSDDPSPSAPKPRTPIPGLPKRTTGSTSPPATAASPPPPVLPSTPAPTAATRDKRAEKPDKAIKPDRGDATMVMSPPPPAGGSPSRPTPAPTPSAPRSRSASTPPRTAPAAAQAPSSAIPAPTPPPAPAPPAPTPPAAAAAPAAAPAPTSPATSPSGRARSDTLDALDALVLEIQAGDSGALSSLGAGGGGPPAHGTSTADDLAAVRSLFQEVAVAHVAQVRDVMLELRYGEADPKWIELTKPALRSLRAMAGQMELTDLCEALDAFVAAVEASVQNRAKISDEDKAELLRRYARLIELIPQAFELDAERDRREPIIVEALLYQVEGVERPVIDKLFAVGLNRLDALMNANASDVAAVSGLRAELAAAVVAQFKSYRASSTSTVAAPDPAAERRQLGDQLIILTILHEDFEKAAVAWSGDAPQRKRSLRKQREQAFQQIKVTLARLGERDLLQRLEKLPYQDRIAAIDRYLSAQPARPST